MEPEIDFPTDLRALESDYELIRELGQGGMAAVYLARRRESGHLVAIKAIRARYLDDPDALQRFAREARTVTDLSHPNIVATEAIVEIGDRAVAIIMQYVPGGTVRDRLREYGPFSAELTESVLRDVARALGYAHARGIVHRDVKPENVFLERATERALLSDFGIARRIEGDAPITLLGASLGTPQYMSPEQIDGRKVDGRTDIYSLGVLGWELLTGRRPWAGENLYGVIYKQKHEELPRITSIRPRAPANLLFAIEGALVKDRERRWQTIDEFLQHLTYEAPPLVAQAPAFAAAEPLDNEPTVKFRRDAAIASTEPPARQREPVPNEVSRRAPAAIPAAPRPSGYRPAPAGSGAKTGDAGRRHVIRALALIAPLAIAGAAAYVLFDGGGPTTATRNASGDVTSSAGSIVLDTSRPASAPAPNAPATVRPPAPTTRSTVPPTLGKVRAADTTRRSTPQPPRRVDNNAVLGRTAPPKPSTGSPTSRCESPSMTDQRACLFAYVAANDVTLQRTYDSLIAAMRRNESARRGAPDPPAVRRLRAEQRSWVSTRDRECTGEVPPGSVALWAEPLAQCFARRSAARAAELDSALARARGGER